jgi:hypothetical protein
VNGTGITSTARRPDVHRRGRAGFVTGGLTIAFLLVMLVAADGS